MAANGREAVEAYRECDPRIVLMDVSMPVMSGLQASQAIRALEKGTDRRVPIVAVTAHMLDGDREECLAAGMDDYLTKPISIEKLEEVIHRWLHAAKSAATRDSVLTLH